MIFMCLQASVARGFEFVQSQWANGGNAFRLAQDQDAIVGPQDIDGPPKMTVPGARRSSWARCRASSRCAAASTTSRPASTGCSTSQPADGVLRRTPE